MFSFFVDSFRGAIINLYNMAHLLRVEQYQSAVIAFSSFGKRVFSLTVRQPCGHCASYLTVYVHRCFIYIFGICVPALEHF